METFLAEVLLDRPFDGVVFVLLEFLNRFVARCRLGNSGRKLRIKTTLDHMNIGFFGEYLLRTRMNNQDFFPETCE